MPICPVCKFRLPTDTTGHCKSAQAIEIFRCARSAVEQPPPADDQLELNSISDPDHAGDERNGGNKGTAGNKGVRKKGSKKGRKKGGKRGGKRGGKKRQKS